MELHRDPDAPPGATTVLAVDGHDVVAAVQLRDDAGGVVALDVEAPERVGRAEARMLLAAALPLTERPGSEPRALMVSDALVRYEARRLGWTGALRAALTPPPRAGAGQVPLSVAAGVAALLPACDVRERRALFRPPDLRVVSVGDGGRVRVRLPREAEIMPEAVAAAVDTVLAVKARFGRAAAGIDAVSFDHGGVALATGDVSGLAEGASGVVVITPNFVAADLLERERGTRAEASRRTRPAPADAVPLGTLDEVVAHECWHYLDAEIRVSGTDYVAFNAALGEALGVDSLELASAGASGTLLPSGARHVLGWSTRCRRMQRRAREATAEMFSLWWCRRGASSTVVARFGDLVDQTFPRRG